MARSHIVYNRKNLFSGDFKEIKQAEILRFDTSINGTGAAEIDIHFADINDSRRNLLDEPIQNELTLDDCVENSWIFIIDTSIVVGNDPSSRFDPLTDLRDTRIVFWGYIADRKITFTKGLKYWQGSISAYEFGHWLSGESIKYPERKSLEVSGFNPSKDGVIIGNRSQDAEDPQPTSDVRYDYVNDIDYFWRIQDVLKFVAKNAATSSIPMEMDFSEVNIENNKFLNNIETIESYVGQSFNQMLQDTLMNLKYYFKILSDSHVSCVVVDTEYTTDPVRYTPSTSRESISVTNSENYYDQINLIGDKILVSGSVSTSYPSDMFVGVDRGWTDTESAEYVKPPRMPATTSVRSSKLSEIIKIIENSTKAAATDVNLQKIRDTGISSVEELIYNSYENERKSRHYKVYKQFVWKLGALNDLYTAGDCLLTSSMPGSIFLDRQTIFPFFPEIQFQNYTRELDSDVLDESVILNGSHMTPKISDLTFEDFIPLLKSSTPPVGTVGAITNYFAPKFYYKTTGQFRKYGADTHAAPMWIDGVNSSGQWQNYSMKTSWNGIEIDSPYPELLAKNLEDIIGDFYSATDFRVDWMGAQHTEWDLESLVGPSKYDPTLTDAQGGHWKRLCFSFSAYSSQNIQLVRKNPNKTVYEKILTVKDDTFKCWLIRKGLAVQTKPEYKFDDSTGDADLTYPDVISTPDWQKEDLFVRNDIKLMKERMKMLEDFYFKPRKAIKIVDRMFNENGDRIDNNLKVGRIIKEIVEQGSEGIGRTPINSFVSSISYEFGHKPRITVQTEIPNGPPRMRNTLQQEMRKLFPYQLPNIKKTEIKV